MQPVRRATPDDAPAVAKLISYVQAWHAQAYPAMFKTDPSLADLEEYVVEELARPDLTTLLSGQPPVAYLICTVQERPASIFQHATKRLFIDHIGTAPGARREGHARALFEAASELANQENCDVIVLDTWAKNIGAHAFFRSMGFDIQRHLFHLDLRP